MRSAVWTLVAVLAMSRLASADDAPPTPTKPLPTPMPASPMPATPPPPSTVMRPKTPAPSSFEGRYRSAASSVEIQVTRLFGDAYQLAGSDGLEGVGFVDGGTYRGVFRNVAAGASGVHAIELADLRKLSVRTSNTSPRSGEVLETWGRLSELSKDLPPPPPNKPIVVTPPPEGHEGDYVYVEELPEAITKVKPVYPDEARRAGVTGTVMVQAHVREDGTVGECRVVKSIPELDAAAIAAVRQWRFKPAMSKGVPVAVPVAVPVKFPPD